MSSFFLTELIVGGYCMRMNDIKKVTKLHPAASRLLRIQEQIDALDGRLSELLQDWDASGDTAKQECANELRNVLSG
jgi:hypothetical protein